MKTGLHADVSFLETGFGAGIGRNAGRNNFFKTRLRLELLRRVRLGHLVLELVPEAGQLRVDGGTGIGGVVGPVVPYPAGLAGPSEVVRLGFGEVVSALGLALFLLWVQLVVAYKAQVVKAPPETRVSIRTYVLVIVRNGRRKTSAKARFFTRKALWAEVVTHDRQFRA